MTKEGVYATYMKYRKLRYSSVFLAIFLVSILTLTGCTEPAPSDTPETVPEEATIPDTQPTVIEPTPAPSDSSTSRQPSGPELTQGPLQLLIRDEFTLGELITDEERGRMFPDIDQQIDEGSLEYPFIMYDSYLGESFFLRERERAQVTLLTNEPTCLWEDDPEFESGVLVYLGPALEYQEEWKWVEGYEETNWLAAHECVIERSDDGWSTIILFNTPLSGHYALYLLNLSKNPVACEFGVMVEAN